MKTRQRGRQSRDRQGVRRRIGELLSRETLDGLVAIREQLERRARLRPPPVDRAAIAAEIDESLKGDEFFDFDEARAVQEWYVGAGNESVRVLIECENPQTEVLYRVVERVIVGKVGIARAAAIELMAMAESFAGVYPEVEAS